MSFLSSIANALTGTVSPQQVSQITGQVQGPSQSAYQIAGMPQYQNALNSLSSQYGNTSANLGGATQGTMGQQQQLGNYFQNVAMGNQQTAADQLLQNSQAQGARQLQSGITSAQGLNPALALRQLYGGQATQQGNIAGQAAQQKLGEQQSYGQMASQQQQQQYQEQFNNVQQTYLNQMQSLKAQQDVAQNIFGANAQQTSYNVSYNQNLQAYQQWQANAQLQAQRDQASSTAALFKGILGGAATIGGAALLGPFGAAAGAGLSGALTSSGSSGGSLNQLYPGTYGGYAPAGA